MTLQDLNQSMRENHWINAQENCILIRLSALLNRFLTKGTIMADFGKIVNVTATTDTENFGMIIQLQSKPQIVKYKETVHP